jgi:dual specificity tyrosine-phosphorylation-regulated kinase 2/3/4
MKVIRNKKKFHSQALIEIQILKVIREVDTSSSSSLIKIKDYLLFRNHVCILFELLSINLFEFLRQNKFNGVSLDLIRRFAIQLLQALLLLE